MFEDVTIIDNVEEFGWARESRDIHLHRDALTLLNIPTHIVQPIDMRELVMETNLGRDVEHAFGIGVPKVRLSPEEKPRQPVSFKRPAKWTACIGSGDKTGRPKRPHVTGTDRTITRQAKILDFAKRDFDLFPHKLFPCHS